MEKWCGIYPKGMTRSAIEELQFLGYEIMKHYEDFQCVIFKCKMQQRPLCLDPMFLMVGSECTRKHVKPDTTKMSTGDRKRKKYVHKTDESTLEFVKSMISASAENNVHIWDKLLAVPWRATTMKTRHIAIHANEINNLFGSFVQAKGPVSLVNFEIEVVIYIGFDFGNSLQDEELWIVGYRKREASLWGEVDKKTSKMGEAVGACVTMAMFGRASKLGCMPNIVYDPMCGVGTLPRMVETFKERNYFTNALCCFTMGSDIEPNSVETYFQWRPSHNVFLANSLNLNVRSNIVDMVIVDPPWGLRHLKFSLILKWMRQWMEEWVRVLKPGGLLGIVTIRINQISKEFEEYFQNRSLKLMDDITFSNQGFLHCKLLIFAKEHVPIE